MKSQGKGPRGGGGKRSSRPAPDLTFREEPAGRATLAAIHVATQISKSPQRTRHYGDRISNAPGAVTPEVARALDETPEILVRHAPAGRETRAALEEELQEAGPVIEIGEDRASSLLPVSVEDLPVEQVFRFEVRGRVEDLAGEPRRKGFWERRIRPHLGLDSSVAMSRIDVVPGKEPGTLAVQVWCRVP